MRPAGRVVLAHVAEPPGELGDPLAVARLALPLDRQVRRLEELGPGDEGDAGLAKDVHGRWVAGVGGVEVASSARRPAPSRLLGVAAAALLDARAGPRAMSSGSATACAPTLSRLIGGSPARKDNAGIEDSEGVEARLTRAKSSIDLVAVDPCEQARRGAGRRRARRTGVPPSRTSASVTSSSSAATAASQPARAELGQQVHVHVPVAGVAEDHHRETARRGGLAHRADVLAHPLHRHAAILDHLERAPASPAARPGSGSRRGAAPRAARPRPASAPCPRRPPTARTAAAARVDRLARGGLVVALDLDQQHGFGAGLAHRARGRCGRAARPRTARAPSSAATASPSASSVRSATRRPARAAGSGSSRHSAAVDEAERALGADRRDRAGRREASQASSA